MPGFTGWFGLTEHGRPKAGETLVVAAATGPVGSMVGQVARLAGLRTVGIAGGADSASDVPIAVSKKLAEALPLAEKAAELAMPPAEQRLEDRSVERRKPRPPRHEADAIRHAAAARSARRRR